MVVKLRHLYNQQVQVESLSVRVINAPEQGTNTAGVRGFISSMNSHTLGVFMYVLSCCHRDLTRGAAGASRPLLPPDISRAVGAAEVRLDSLLSPFRVEAPAGTVVSCLLTVFIC